MQQEQNANATPEIAAKLVRRPKKGNSDEFNRILSAANALSVSERTRLVKSLAGQLGLITIGSGELLRNAGKQAPPKKESTKQQAVVRPNPLKGTAFDSEKKQALQALQEAKKAASGAQLPKDHPAVVRYAAALSAYKAEHEKLRVVETDTQQSESNKSRARKHADRSPEPRGPTTTTTTTNLIGRLSGALRPSTKPKVSEQMEEDKL